MKEIYNLKNNLKLIKFIQEASNDTKSFAGFKVENDMLFGSKEWFSAIEKGEIKSFDVKGVITDVTMAGHNDFPEFILNNSNGTSVWPQEGEHYEYIIGNSLKLTYVEQKYKRPSDFTGAITKCIIKINECNNSE